MKKPDKNNRSRRNFISTGILAGVGLLTEKSIAASLSEATGKKIKMLTATGKLVEVDEALVNNARKGERAENKSILKWMQSGAKNK